MQATHNTQASVSVPVPSTISARVTKIDGIPQRARMHTFVVKDGQTMPLEYLFHDDDGNSYDLTDATGTFVCKAVETACKQNRYDLTATILTPGAGLLCIEYPAMKPGIYECDLDYLVDGACILSNRFMLYVSQKVGEFTGPPSLLEIRLQLRDTSPEENYLLDGLAFSDEEIVLAATMAVNYFNEVNPAMGYYVSTQYFPWRYHWIEGIIGKLFGIAAESFGKNSLDYQAGGLSVADMNKEQHYRALGAEHWQAYQMFVRNLKGQINMSNCFHWIP